MHRHLITAAILLLAIALYSFGMSGGSALLFAAGAVLELWFWVRVLRRSRSVGTASTER